MKQKRLRMNKTALLAALAVLLVLGTSITASMAYFTTFAEAEGGQELSLRYETELDEGDGPDKQVSIQNTGDIECYVRVKAFAPGGVVLDYTPADSDWEKPQENGDGYWYYNKILPAGEATSILKIAVNSGKTSQQLKNFNVVVVQECTPVLYDSDGKPYADWNKTVNANGGGDAQ